MKLAVSTRGEVGRVIIEVLDGTSLGEYCVGYRLENAVARLAIIGFNGPVTAIGIP